jgi:hypothetical protein
VPVAKFKCTDINVDQNFLQSAQFVRYESDIRGAIATFLGTDSELRARLSGGSKLENAAFKAWKQFKDNLIDKLLRNGLKFSADLTLYNYREKIDQLKDTMQKLTGVPASPETIWKRVNPRRILAVSKILNSTINLQESRWGKKLPWLERALLPPIFFTMRIDPFGFIHKFILQSQNLLENTRRSSARFKASFEKTYADYMQSVRNVAHLLPYVSKEYVLDGLKIRGKDGIPYLFLGSQEDENQILTHKVINEQTGEEDTLSQNLLGHSDILDALTEKYVFELTNDILDGQVRPVVWVETADLPQLKEVIIEGRMKLNNKKANSTAKDLAKGIPEFHETTYRGIKYFYAMAEDPVDNRWKAVIVSYKDESGKRYWLYNNKGEPINVDKRVSLSEIGGPFKDGWYKSKDYHTFGTRTRAKTGKPIWDSFERDWSFSDLAGSKMTDPHPDLIHREVGARDVRLSSSNLFTTIGKMRSIYNSIGAEIDRVSKMEVDGLNQWLGKDGKFRPAMEKVLGKGEVADLFDQLGKIIGISGRFWFDNQGNIHTPNSTFRMLKNNYSPRVYDDVAINSMLDGAIEEMEGRLADMEAEGLTDVDIGPARQKLMEFQLTRARRDENTALAEELEVQLAPVSGIGQQVLGQINTREILAQRAVHTKHRGEWTNPVLRKKDSEVHGMYLDNTFQALHKNRLMLIMLETLTRLAVAEPGSFNNDMYKWAINRLRVSFNDPDAIGGIGKWDYSYKTIAEKLNKLPGQSNHTAQSVRRQINHTKGTLSAILLGAGGALKNRTQIVNEYIKWGWNSLKETMAIVAGKDPLFTAERVQAIIDHVGIDEITNMFMDVMAAGGDITFADAALIGIPGTRIIIPRRAWFDFMNMIRKGREQYIKKGIPEIDLALKRIEFNRIENQHRRLQSKKEAVLAKIGKRDKVKIQRTMRMFEREERKLKSPSQVRTVQSLRENYLDLIMTPKEENNNRILRARFKKVMGDVAENRMKRIISWKLSWWFDSFAPELFTFTEGERIMRRQTAIIALINTANMGGLGRTDWRQEMAANRGKTVDVKVGEEIKEVTVPDIFLSDAAIRVARNSVVNSMFGMSPVHLGDAFIGAGAHFGLYKAYPLNQMIHDWNILKTYMAGNVHKSEAITRLKDVFINAGARAQAGIKYDPTDTSLDHEALQMLRFIGSRFAMSALSILLEQITIFRFLFRSPLMKQWSSMVRGGENPALAIAMRLMINGLIWSFLDEDDWFEGDLIEVGWDIARLIFPVFLTLPLNYLWEALD